MSFSDELSTAGITATRFASLTGFDKRTVVKWCKSLRGVPSHLEEIVRIQLEKIEAGEIPPTIAQAHQYQNGRVAGVWEWNRFQGR